MCILCLAEDSLETSSLIFSEKQKQEGHEALNRSPEYTGQSQTFNFEIWMTFGQVQRMTLTFDTHSTSLTHLAECFKRL